MVDRMREYRVDWDGSNPGESRITMPDHPGSQPQMGEHVIMRDIEGTVWPARVGWDPRIGWVLIPETTGTGIPRMERPA